MIDFGLIFNIILGLCLFCVIEIALKGLAVIIGLMIGAIIYDGNDKMD